jgi:hypothetical protein
MEGSESVANCHRLKLEATDGKNVVSGENYLPSMAQKKIKQLKQ